MTLYFFDVFDGEAFLRDDVGVDISTEQDAANHAVAALPEMAHDELQNGPERSFWVKVRDGSGDYFFMADLKFKQTWLKR